jgi:hypothetical protein
MSGKTTVSAANFKDSNANTISNATIWFQPCTVPGNQPIAYHGGGDDAGPRSSRPVSVACASGAFSIQLDDVSLTLPPNIGYLVTAIDDVSGVNLLGPGWVIQPTAANFSLDGFQPNLPTMVTVQIGPEGRPGAPGEDGVLTGTARQLQIDELSSNVFGAIFGVGDINGNYPVLMFADGKVSFAKLQAYFGGTVLQELEENANGYVGLVIRDQAGNVAFAVDGATGKIVGSLLDAPSQGKPFMLGGAAPVALYGLNILLVMGESLASGALAGVITTAQPFNNIMFQNGVRCGQGTPYPGSNPPITANLNSFTPLIQILNGSLGETVANGMADRAVSDLMGIGLKPRFLATVSSQPGAPYAGIAPGSGIYAQALQMVAAAVSLGVPLYGSVGCPCTAMVLGVNDEVAGTANFAADMLAIQAQAETDIKAATGQGAGVPMAITQESSWGSSCPSRASSGYVTPIVAQQQVAVAMANSTKLLFAGPEYFLPVSMYQPDGIHLTADGYRWLGEYIGEAQAAYIAGHTWKGLTPKSAILCGSRIVLLCNVPCAPLAIDKTRVSEPTVPSSSAGFEAFSSGGARIAISSVTVGPDGASIVIQLAARPSAPVTLCYAWSAPAGALSGATAGARGNIRDSNPASSFYGYENMFHWLPTFTLTTT